MYINIMYLVCLLIYNSIVFSSSSYSNIGQSSIVRTPDSNQNQITEVSNKDIYNMDGYDSIEDRVNFTYKDFVLEKNMFYRKSKRLDEAVVYIHGRNSNIINFLEINTLSDIFCLMSPNIQKHNSHPIFHKRNWFKGYIPLTLLAPLCLDQLFRTMNLNIGILPDVFYKELIKEIEIYLLPMIDDIYNKLKDYKVVKLVGHSQGAMVASVLAHELRKKGKTVDLIVNIGSFMVQESDINTVFLYDEGDNIVSANKTLGSISNYYLGENINILKGNTGLSHNNWPWFKKGTWGWSHNIVQDVVNSNINKSDYQEVAKCHEFEYSDIKKEYKSNIFAYYAFIIVYYIFYIPLKIIDYFIY